MGKGVNQTTSQTAPNPQAMAAYTDLMSRAQGVASTPYQAYTGQQVANFTPQQQQAFQQTSDLQGIANPYIQSASGYAQQGASGITPGAISGYMNPYQSDVISATMGNIQENNQQQQQSLKGNEIAQGALGGDRNAVASAELSRQQNLASNQTLAGLNAQNYSQALGAAQQDRSAAAQGAYTFGNLGQEALSTGLTGTQALLGTGGLQQQLSQAQLNVPYQQWQQAQAFPYQQTQWLAGLETGVGSNMGGTSSTTAPAPNQAAQWAGLGLAGVGMFANRGGRIEGYDGGGIVMPYSGASSWIPGNSITRGKGAPVAPYAYNPGQQGNPLGNANSAMKAFHDRDAPDTPMDIGSPQGIFTPSMVGSIDPGGTSPAASGLGPLYKRGGFVVSQGGRVIDLYRDPNGIHVPRGYAGGGSPVGGGLDPNPYGDPSWDDPSQQMQPMDILKDAFARNSGQRWGENQPSSGGFDRSTPDSRLVNPGGDPSWNDPSQQIPSTSGVRSVPINGISVPANQGAIDATDIRLDTGNLGLGKPVDWSQDQNTTLAQVNDQGSGVPVYDKAVASGYTGNAPAKAIGDPALGFQATVGDGGVETKAGSTDDSGAPEGKRAGFGLGFLSPAAKAGLMAAGFGMMASNSPFLGTAIGQGGLSGIQAYSGEQKQEREEAKAQSDIAYKKAHLGLESQKLTQAAEQARKTLQMHTEQQKFQQMQPVRIDTLMGPISARRNEDGTYTNILTGKPVDQGTGTPFIVPGDTTTTPQQRVTPQSDGNLASTDDPAKLPEKSQLVSGDTPANVQPAILASLDPQIALQVKALAEGRMPFPSGMALKTPYWQNMLSKVAQYDPSFDAINYNARAKARNDFTSGKSAQNLTSLNTAVSHLDSLDRSIDGLNNTRFPDFNAMSNWLNVHGGNQDFQNRLRTFQTAKQALTDELTRAFRGSGGNVHDIVQWEQKINEADSPVALHGVTKEAVKLLQGRIDAIGDQYNRGMGTTRDPMTLLSPKAQASIDRIVGGGASSGATTQTGTTPRAVSLPQGTQGTTTGGPPPMESRVVGKVYNSPSGPVRWTGTGWAKE